MKRRGSRRPETCRAKTAIGNVFAHKRVAKKVARNMRQRNWGDRVAVVAYQCGCCGLWHVGGQRPATEVSR